MVYSYLRVNSLTSSECLKNIINYYIFQNYNIDEDFNIDDMTNSIFTIEFGFYISYEIHIFINKNEEKTFPRQIYNRYDYFVVFYKRQIHKMMIRKWKCAIYRPNSKYVLKLKDHFEKIKN